MKHYTLISRWMLQHLKNIFDRSWNRHFQLEQKICFERKNVFHVALTFASILSSNLLNSIFPLLSIDGEWISSLISARDVCSVSLKFLPGVPLENETFAMYQLMFICDIWDIFNFCEIRNKGTLICRNCRHLWTIQNLACLF